MSSYSRLCALGALALALASCGHSRALPPPPDASVAQKATWQVVPDDALGGVVIADFGHELERMRALKAVLDTGPVTRTYVQKGMARAMLALGFDPLDPEGWKKAGVDPNGPVAIFGREDKVEVVFQATDGQKAHDTMQAWFPHRDDGAASFDCAAVGSLHRCGSSDWQLATDPAHSLWQHLDTNLPQAARSLGILGYVPLDRGPIGKITTTAQQGSPYAGAHAAYLGTTWSAERYIARIGVRSEFVTSVAPFLEPRPHASLLGLADGAIGVSRLTFSPDKTLELAKRTMKRSLPTLDIFATVEAATGIDLDHELRNLTGELEMVTYRGERYGVDGKHRPLQQRLATTFVFGTVDDADTRHFTQRLGEIAAGALATLGDLKGMKVTYRAEAGDRPVHWFTIEMSGEAAALVPGGKMELYLTSFPGGIAIGEGRESLEQLRKHVGHSASAFIAKLPLPEERAMFERAHIVGWSKTGEAFAQRIEDMPGAAPLMSLLGPDATKGISEVMQLGQLLFDGSSSWEIDGNLAEIYSQVTFL